MPMKTETCCDIRNVAKLMPKMSPKYLVRSPVSILIASQFIVRPPNSFLWKLHIQHYWPPTTSLLD